MHAYMGGRNGYRKGGKEGKRGEPVRLIRKNEEIRVKEEKVNKMAHVSAQKPEGDLPFPLSPHVCSPLLIYIWQNTYNITPSEPFLSVQACNVESVHTLYNQPPEFSSSCNMETVPVPQPRYVS